MMYARSLGLAAPVCIGSLIVTQHFRRRTKSLSQLAFFVSMKLTNGLSLATSEHYENGDE